MVDVLLITIVPMYLQAAQSQYAWVVLEVGSVGQVAVLEGSAGLEQGHVCAAERGQP